MAEAATLARPYANAIFDIAKADGRLDVWSRALAFLAGASEESAVKALIESPSVSSQEKAFKLADLVGDELGDKGRQLLTVLAANKRLDLLSEIQDQFEALKAEEESTLDVEVVSAFELSSDERERITAALIARYSREVQMTTKVDEALIGGAIIRAGDTVIDGSVRGKLNKLEETIGRG
jgi:F-type H+-transporting ATPase subunit delta